MRETHKQTTNVHKSLQNAKKGTQLIVKHTT